MNFNLFTMIFLVATGCYLATLLYLNLRQNRAVKKSFDSVPQDFINNISIEEHQKAANYTQAKIKIGNIEMIFSSAILLLWTIGGGIDYLDQVWQSQTDNNLSLGVGVLISIMIIGSIIDLPFSIYRTFVLEQNFGFNKTNIKTFISDIIKALLITLAIGLPMIYLILYLMSIIYDFAIGIVYLLLLYYTDY